MGLSASKEIPFPNSKLDLGGFLELTPKLMGDNGPGDQFAGDFFNRWHQYKGMKFSQNQQYKILEDHAYRFLFCGSNKKQWLEALVVKNKIYIIHTNVKPQCYTLTITFNDLNKMKSKWHKEHGRKTCT